MTHQLWNGLTTHPAEMVGEEPVNQSDDEYVIKVYGKQSDKCACELTDQVSVDGLCRIWNGWRNHHDLRIMLHGFLMISGMNFMDPAWNEIDFLYAVIIGEQDD